MRHFLCSKLGLPMLVLPCCMLASAPARALVLGTGLPLRRSPAEGRALARAVDLPVIAEHAHADLAAAERAGEEPQLGLGVRLAIKLPDHGAHCILRPGTHGQDRTQRPVPLR